MSTEEKISLIEQCMDLEEGTLQLESQVNDFEEWDSLTALSVIAVVAEKTNHTISGEDLKKAKTVSDIVALFH